LGHFNDYLNSLAEPYDFSGKQLRHIMSTFQEPFNHHFHHEIETIASFADLATAPKPGSPEAEHAAAVFKTWGKKTVTKAGTFDVSYENGRWASWPPMPAPIRWGLVNIAGAYYWGRWKFASCDAAGKPRELYALQFPEISS
jgi:hypothetical protein